MRPFPVRLTFHGDLDFFLRSKSSRSVERALSERTSIKDVIESCGVPHPEVDLILIDGKPEHFNCVLESEANVEVYAVSVDRRTFFPEKRLQVTEIKKFVADGHLGKLARDLRLLGLDVLYDPAAEDRQLLDTAKIENRALLTRDRRLLMHAVVQHGYCVRSQQPLEQTAEVLRRFDLAGVLAPFTRCLRCNARLESVKKAVVVEQLEPLTKIYYDEFRRCAACGQIYWRGSHYAKLQARVAQLTQRL
ncbi:MAG TPA: Mut7-C RNAse domain-containing protein [Chthoniobacterales bacterium]|nr:Mut7-C RNAse domain-containing protein [Chthoniobacterales bacterium]